MRNVKGAIDQHFEQQAGPGAKLQTANAAFDAVAERGELDAGELD